MNEARVWKYLNGGMKKMGIYADRVENVVSTGYPDVSYVGYHAGFIELKYMPAFPKRISTPVRIPKLRPEQQLWMWTRGKLNGLCWLFIRVDHQHFLFSWDQIYLVETWERPQWMYNARGQWGISVDWQEMKILLSTPVRVGEGGVISGCDSQHGGSVAIDRVTPL